MKTLRILLASSVLLPFAALAANATESPLGSASAAVGRYTTDYATAVHDALPPIDAAALGERLAAVEAAAASETPLAVTSVAELESFFGLPPHPAAETADLFIDTRSAAYRYDSAAHRLYLSRRYSGVPAVARETGAAELPKIRAVHADLADRLGIPRSEIFFSDTRQIVSQLEGPDDTSSPIEGEGAMTTVLRAVGGVQVEQSHVRLVSVDADRLELADVRWPPVRLVAAARTGGLRSPAAAAAGITQHVTAISGGDPVAVRMAVVLRPVGGDQYVPSLRVAVEPKALPNGDGYRTDAGEVFYSDLLLDSPALADPSPVTAPEQTGNLPSSETAADN